MSHLRCLFLLPFVLLVSTVTRADEVPFPQTPQPSIRMAMVNEDGSLTVQVTHEIEVKEVRTTTIEVEEQRFIYEKTNEGLKLTPITVAITREVEYIVSVPRWETREYRALAGAFTGYTVNGDLVVPEDLAKRLKKLSTVVISAERTNVIDPLFLSVLNEKAIILVVDARLTPENPDQSEAPASPAPEPVDVTPPVPAN